jgi:peptidoglycan/xylan/chitin deacetylase (PgdA/CDA1 family)
MGRTFWITTSWDDGHRLDLRVAEYLDRYGLAGTFYVAREYLDAAERLSDDEIARLSARHEIGAHTLTHPVLTQVDESTARREIEGSRDWLSQVTGRPITAFCYPRGLYNTAVRALVAAAGFSVARTVAEYRLDAGHDPLAVPTTVHIYPFPLRPTPSWRARFEPVQRALPHVVRLHLSPLALRNWRTLAQNVLDRAAATGGIWHLWGHGWEVERYGMWSDLECVLEAAGRYPGARFVTNSELAQEVFTRDERRNEVLQRP